MSAITTANVCRVAAYYRLSEKDKAKAVSDSIENQQKLVREYLSHHEGMELLFEYYDDGYTGTNYNRPGFCAVMEKVKSGEVDCIIVKDLSRLGREYIETGKYLEETFPDMGVRFIAINDDYDSDTPKQSDDILIPVKNLMNETYCRELSVKLRKQFAVQRKNGEYLGAFASYGYCKSPDDRHRLIVDEYAAQIVRDIFHCFIRGYSQGAIANTLNAEGVLPPSEYKRQQGLNYKSGFRTAQNPKWSAAAITSILKNRVYIGELIQGKRGTPNFKLKIVRERKEEDWVIVKDNHEAIIEPLMFDVVQRMLTRDTRTSPDRETVLPLGGVVFCADCGRASLLRSVTRAKKKYCYYVCSTSKRGEGCTSHSIEKTQLENAVLNAIRMQIQLVVELDALLESIKSSDIHAARVNKVKLQIKEKEKELDGCKEFKSRLFEALNDNLIDREEFTRMRDKYRGLEAECSNAIEKLYEKLNTMETEGNPERSWVEQYAKYRDLPELTREAVVALIDKVIIYEDKRIDIQFNYKNEIAYYSEIVKTAMKEVG